MPEVLNRISVDLDKTLAHNSPHPEYELLGPVDGAQSAMSKLMNMGYKVIICSSRDLLDFWKVFNWLQKHKIPFDSLDLGHKYLCEHYIDDKGIKFDGDWDRVLCNIKDLTKL